VHLLDSKKITIVEGDLALTSFGLDVEVYKQMRNSVTHIIHSAWTINFAAPLGAYDDLLNGTCRLIQFASSVQDRTPPVLSYISTIGVKQHRDGAILQEEPLTDPNLAVSTGYAESKWVAEQIILTARNLTGLKGSIIRVGVLAGSINGVWNCSHWFPSLVQSGKYVGCLPDGDSPVSWVSIDMAANAVVDLMDSETAVVNVVHPNPTNWGSIMKELSEYLHLPLVPYAEWFGCIEGASREKSASLDIQGALKLVDMFRHGIKPHQGFESMGLLSDAVFDKALAASPTLQAAKNTCLGKSDIQQWVDRWREVGML